jgi:hypothetical protein
MVAPVSETPRVDAAALPAARWSDWLARAAAGFWIACIVGALGVGAFGSAELRDRAMHDGPGCPFRLATGWDCAFCGMTRATVSLGHGDFGAAFGYHPLAPLVLVAMLVLCGAIVFGRGDRMVRGRTPVGMLTAIAVVWILNLAL